jgi:hypothetical protein
LAVLAGAALGAACDAGTFRVDPATQPAAPLRLLGANVGTNAKLPENGVIQLAFDRYLLPGTETRQSALLTPVGSGSVTPAIVTYDPVARVVTLASPNGAGAKWLEREQSYKLTLPVPTEENPGFGFRAIDGAPLAEPITIQFVVGAPSTAAPADPKVSFCHDVAPLFAKKCSGNTCHGGSASAAAGLVLTTSAGLAGTAFRVAQGANTGGAAQAGSGASPNDPVRPFGIDMPIIAPRNPGQSWLLYKTLLAPLPTVAVDAKTYVCGQSPGAPIASFALPAGATEAPSDSELAVLRDHVLGVEMPFPPPGRVPPVDENRPLTFLEREVLRLWIAQGATVVECGGSCAPASDGGVDAAQDAQAPDASPDASPDAQPSDAGAD